MIIFFISKNNLILVSDTARESLMNRAIFWTQAIGSSAKTIAARSAVSGPPSVATDVGARIDEHRRRAQALRAAAMDEAVRALGAWLRGRRSQD